MSRLSGAGAYSQGTFWPSPSPQLAGARSPRTTAGFASVVIGPIIAPRSRRSARAGADTMALHERIPMTSPFDVDALRTEFPSLAVEQDGRPIAYFDGPGGTQVPQRVIDAVTGYYRETNANSGGAFTTSEQTDAIAAEAHAAMVDF